MKKIAFYINNDKKRTSIRIDVLCKLGTPNLREDIEKIYHITSDSDCAFDIMPKYKVTRVDTYYFEEHVIANNRGAYDIVEGTTYRPTRCPKCKGMIGYVQQGFVMCPRCRYKFRVVDKWNT